MEPGMPRASFNMPYGADSCSYEVVQQQCVNGHTWCADMFFELGGRFYVNDADEMCPECGEWNDL
jgi:hypothetical protein